ncbi:hypothetical protein U1E44_03420 [Arenibacter sp. GZD96]|uniref:hypothetical protein n=1 Tax=Aurantibrevibacter litoralis TaxID=3106030 RepID=UPI002B0022B1|nr:hypothetical protein [Arenibacter sp. GZD-96]MEA1785128.1 hypothetical protein [Arenibacter sp. GZD-96]
MKKLLLPVALILFGCKQPKLMADLVVYNANIYTVDSIFSKAEAFAVKDGKFVTVGNNADILATYDAKNRLDAH